MGLDSSPLTWTSPARHSAGFNPPAGPWWHPIELATGRKPYFVGKPNALMMRTALRKLGAHSSEAFMVGDRMDTDIVAGFEAGMRTILVLSGVTTREMIDHYPYLPTLVFEDVGEFRSISSSQAKRGFDHGNRASAKIDAHYKIPNHGGSKSQPQVLSEARLVALQVLQFDTRNSRGCGAPWPRCTLRSPKT